jgi:hypothetical protein
MAVLFFFSYQINFVWESLHAVYLYEGHDFSARKYVRMVGYVSAVDGLFIVVVYLFISLLWRTPSRRGEITKGQAIAACALWLVMAAVLEYEKVYVLREWSYSAHMPTIFGIGMSPLLQLPLTGLVTLLIARKILS